MEIKRQLNKIAKRLSPQIEAMNIGTEMAQITRRLDELVTYAEQKIENAKERKVTIGQAAKERKEREEKEMRDAMEAEARERAEDQQQVDAQPDAADTFEELVNAGRESSQAE